MIEPTLEFIGGQLDRLLAGQRDMRADLMQIKQRLTALESAFGLLLTQLATLNSRIDRIEERR